MKLSTFFVAGFFLCCGCAAFATALPKPDITVAADGSGDFKTIQAAVASIPSTNRERVVVFIKDGVYKEKVRVDASFVTLRGQSRKGTRIEFPQLNDDFTKNPDELGRAVINVNGDDFVLENLTAENTAGIVGPTRLRFTARATARSSWIATCSATGRTPFRCGSLKVGDITMRAVISEARWISSVRAAGVTRRTARFTK